jgi:hypothetical protein
MFSSLLRVITNRQSRCTQVEIVQSPWEHRFEWERCERRLALSAMPWIPVDIAPVHVDPLESYDSMIVHHNVLESQVALPPIAPHLAEAHQRTGWNQVQSQFGLKGTGQTVAVIDSGIAFNHVALGGGFGANHRVVGGWDFAENDANPFDDAPAGFHGTHVAGIIGANQGAKQGVAPNVDFVALRAFTDSGQGNLSWVESALQWVYDNKNKFEYPITTVNLSLGSTWNSSNVPGWATLENELQQLHQAGIVVVASAGNSFQQNQVPGLAYPAASPYVIPVASIDDNNQLSNFSQRDNRIIAAPGRNIESTVPDHFWGADGVYNDWANSSGTSMAAPYVAGASVLVREAMQLVGMQNITVQSIYDTLRNSATDIFDSVTNQSYKSLDLNRAIDSILPDDDIGGTLETARTVNLQSSLRSDSWLNSLNDQDVYRLSPTQSGIVRLQLSSEQLDHETIAIVRNGQTTQLSLTNGLAQFQVNAGESIGVMVRDGDSIGKYSLDWNFAPSHQGGGGSGGSSGGTSQGGGTSLPSFATMNGTTLNINGTSDANQILLDLRQGVRVSLDGIVREWAASAVRNIVIDGMQNNDTIQMIGSTDADKVELKPGLTTLKNDALSVEVRNVETIRFEGGGGPDRAYLYDEATDDRLTIYPNKAELLGAGYKFQVESVSRIFVHALSGGDDQAYVYDSNGDDTLFVRPQFTSLSGAGYFNYISGFERVFAYANGGTDRAQLYDSTGNDVFHSSQQVSSITGPGFSTFARGFTEAEAFATAGGVDRAVLYTSTSATVSSGSDFRGTQDGARSSMARYFEQVQVVPPSLPTATLAVSPQSEMGENDVQGNANIASGYAPFPSVTLPGRGDVTPSQNENDRGFCAKEEVSFGSPTFSQSDRMSAEMGWQEAWPQDPAFDFVRLMPVESTLERIEKILDDLGIG